MLSAVLAVYLVWTSITSEWHL